MKIVFVHGRAQEGKEPVALRQTWEDSFREGLRNADLSLPEEPEFAFPYYGDTLDRLIDELEAPLVADVVEKGAAQDDAEAAFRAELLEELKEGTGLTDDDVRETFERDYPGEVVDKGPLNWKWVRAIMKTLDKSKKIGDKVIDAFTRDVYVYLTNRAVRKRIDAIVEPHLGGDPCVVVGHSLGSIVAYNVLRSHPAKVSRYVTVGSPLGIKAIKRRLEAPLTMPANTTSWHNARDPQDAVALFPLTAEHFDVTPAILNHDGVDNQTDNQHGIIGYLPDGWVAKAIHGGLIP